MNKYKKLISTKLVIKCQSFIVTKCNSQVELYTVLDCCSYHPFVSQILWTTQMENLLSTQKTLVLFFFTQHSSRLNGALLPSRRTVTTEMLSPSRLFSSLSRMSSASQEFFEVHNETTNFSLGLPKDEAGFDYHFTISIATSVLLGIMTLTTIIGKLFSLIPKYT